MNRLDSPRRWYQGITRYQWLVLLIASLGWIFDVFEGQIFVASMNEAMPALAPLANAAEREYYNKITLAAFLVGGALGGVLFGMLGDRYGRTRAMQWTILMYSAFTCVSAFSGAWWHMAGFRFLVAMGVGGEWAVASALVAEVFPKHARAWSQSIFHASSVIGSWLAAAVGALLISNPDLRFSLELGGTTWELTNWRLAFLVGVVPALLILWVRISLREPEAWLRSRSERLAGQKEKSLLGELFVFPWRRRTLVGVGLATVGLATFWGAHIYGKDVMRSAYEARYLAALDPDDSPEVRAEAVEAYAPAIKRAEMLGMFLVTTGGGLGLLSFGPLSERVGRRGAFLLFQLGGLAATLILFNFLTGIGVLWVALPLFGFLTLGMHAGYAVYFPELFPTRLRSTGSGFCFNVGRFVAAPALIVSGWMQKDWKLSLATSASLLALLFIPGMLLLLFAPETRGKELPE